MQKEKFVQTPSKNQFKNMIDRIKSMFTSSKSTQRENYINVYSPEMSEILNFIKSQLSERMLVGSSISHRNRIEKYNDFVYIYRKIPEQQKQLRVLISYILKPDHLTKNILNFNFENDLQEEYVNQLFKYLQIESKLYNVLFNMLLFGNQYLRIHYKRIDTIKRQDLNNNEELKERVQSTLKEQFQIQQKKGLSIDHVIEVLDKNIKITNNIQKKQVLKDNKISIEQDNFKEIIEEQLQEDTQNEVKQNNRDYIYVPIFIEVIHPKNIVNLKEYGLNGYLYIPDSVLNKFEGQGRQQELFSGLGIQKDPLNSFIEGLKNQLVEEFGNNIYKNHIIIKTEEGHQIEFLLQDEVVDFKNMIQNFYEPYGVSIFEHIKGLQLELMIIELTMLIYKINRSPDRRIIRVPIDDINPQDVPQYIESLKQKLKNDVTLDLDGNIQQIPQMLSILDDIWIPQKNGEGLFEIELMQGGEIQNFKDELQYLRNKLIQTLGVPPEYVGYEEGHQTGTRLLQQDEQFQRDVVQFQRFVEMQLDDLLFFLLNRLDQIEFYESNQITLSKPEFFSKLLYYEIQKEKLEYQNSLRDLGIPEEYLLKEILDFSNEDLELIQKYKDKEKILKDKEEM